MNISSLIFVPLGSCRKVKTSLTAWRIHQVDQRMIKVCIAVNHSGVVSFQKILGSFPLIIFFYFTGIFIGNALFLRTSMTLSEIKEVLSSQTKHFEKSQELFFPTVMYCKCQSWIIQKWKVKKQRESMKWEDDSINILLVSIHVSDTWSNYWRKEKLRLEETYGTCLTQLQPKAGPN